MHGSWHRGGSQKLCVSQYVLVNRNGGGHETARMEQLSLEYCGTRFDPCHASCCATEEANNRRLAVGIQFGVSMELRKNFLRTRL